MRQQNTSRSSFLGGSAVLLDLGARIEFLGVRIKIIEFNNKIKLAQFGAARFPSLRELGSSTAHNRH